MATLNSGLRGFGVDIDSIIADVGTKAFIVLFVALVVLLTIHFWQIRRTRLRKLATEARYPLLYLHIWLLFTVVGCGELLIGGFVTKNDDWSQSYALVWFFGQMLVLAVAGDPFAEKVGPLSPALIPAACAILGCIAFIFSFFGYIDFIGTYIVIPYAVLCALLLSLKPRKAIKKD